VLVNQSEHGNYYSNCTSLEGSFEQHIGQNATAQDFSGHLILYEKANLIEKKSTLESPLRSFLPMGVSSTHGPTHHPGAAGRWLVWMSLGACSER